MATQETSEDGRGRVRESSVGRSGKSVASWIARLSQLAPNLAPPEEIIRGLATTSDKIRALARAGYLRTAISKFLGVRYQHVRKVLVDVGITEGLQRSVEMKRSTETIEVRPSERVQTPPSVLLAAGFQPVGVWQLVD